MTDSKPAATGKAPWRWLLLCAVVIGLFVVSRFLPFDEWIAQFTRWIEAQGALGVALFVGAYVSGTILFFPGSLLTLAAGVAFGPWGIPVALGSATIGAALAFLVARYLARGVIEGRAQQNPRFAAIDAAVGENGWKIVGLLRLSPLVPFNLANYFFGLTRVGFWPYVAASFVGMAPGTSLYVYLGHVGRVTLGGGQETSVQQWVLLGVGLAATVAITLYLTRIARKALKSTAAASAGEPRV